MLEARIDRAEVIDRIMTLSGTPVKRRDKVRENFGELGADELDKMLFRLESAGKRASDNYAPAKDVDQKRVELRERQAKALESIGKLSSRMRARSAVGAPVVYAPDSEAATVGLVSKHLPVDDSHFIENELFLDAAENAVWHNALLKVGALIGDDFDTLDETAQAVPKPEIFDVYMRHVFAKASRDTVRLIGYSASRAVADAMPYYTKIIEHDAAALEPVFLAGSFPRLTPTSAVEGLAKLYCYCDAFSVDRVISLESGGSNVSRFLSKELEINGKKIHHLSHIHPKRRGDLDLAFIGNDDRIVIVLDHVSLKQEWQLEQLQRRLLDRVSAQNICIMAVSGRAESYERLSAVTPVYFPHLSVGHDVTPPWDTKGEYVRNRTNHVFGNEASGHFQIARQFVKSVTDSILTMLHRAHT